MVNSHYPNIQPERPIISILEARKLLGLYSRKLDDKSVLDTINALDKIAKLLANNDISDNIITEQK